MLRIAPLKRSDVDRAKRVIATVVLEYYFHGRYTPEELLSKYEKSGYLDDLSRLEKEYAGNNGLLLGVFEEDSVVGIGGVRQMDVNTGELVRLWLLREFRGRRMGKALVERLVAFARNVGWKRLRLDTSHRCKEAVALFRKMGFREVSPYKESIGDCFMELDLSKPPEAPSPRSASP